jgi:hypothetical protein
MNLYDQTKQLQEQTAAGFSAARSGLVQDDLKKYGIPLNLLAVTATGALLGATAGTPSGALGLTMGTHGTGSPTVVGEAASGNTKTDKARFTFALPPEYVDGESVTVRVRAKEAVGAATVSTTIDVECYKSDKEGGIGSDICATAAQDVTTSFANADFVITPTGLVAGDVLDIELTGVTTDTGGTVGTILTIGSVEVLCDIKG